MPYYSSNHLSVSGKSIYFQLFAIIRLQQHPYHVFAFLQDRLPENGPLYLDTPDYSLV